MQSWGRNKLHAAGAVNPDDPYDLKRFLSAQEGVYERALAELRGGQKRTHWMWFIFPLLGKRLLECTEAVVALKGGSVSEIFGYPDDVIAS